MTLSTLPTAVAGLLLATASHDRSGVLSSFADDAVLTDMGHEHRGDEIAKWCDTLYLGSNVVVHPLNVEERNGEIALAVAVNGDYASVGVTEPFQLDWFIKVKDGRISSLRMVEEKLDLPKPILSFVQAMNMFDLNGMVATFAPDAIVNDQMREYVGTDAIRAWLAKEIAGDKVTMFVTQVLPFPGGYAVHANVTGQYDKTGLPDPLQLRFYFSFSGQRIGSLVIIPAKRPS
jgi:ketosteroid isomerase-like protein